MYNVYFWNQLGQNLAILAIPDNTFAIPDNTFKF